MKIREFNHEDLDNIIKLVKQGLSDFGLTYSSETSEADLENIQKEYFQDGGTFLILER